MSHFKFYAHSSADTTASHLFKSTSLICLTATAVTSGLVQLSASTSTAAIVAVVLPVKGCSLLLFSLPAEALYAHQYDFSYEKPKISTDQCWLHDLYWAYDASETALQLCILTQDAASKTSASQTTVTGVRAEEACFKFTWQRYLSQPLHT